MIFSEMKNIQNMNERKLALNVTQLRYIQYECLYVVTVIHVFLNILTRLDIEQKKLTDI